MNSNVAQRHKSQLLTAAQPENTKDKDIEEKQLQISLCNRAQGRRLRKNSLKRVKECASSSGAEPFSRLAPGASDACGKCSMSHFKRGEDEPLAGFRRARMELLLPTYPPGVCSRGHFLPLPLLLFPICCSCLIKTRWFPLKVC